MPMATVTIHQAKTNLSALIRRVEAGEEIIIARRDKPVVVLKEIKAADDGDARRRRGLGSLKGKFPVPDDRVFFGPFTEEENIEMFGKEFVELMKGYK